MTTRAILMAGIIGGSLAAARQSPAPPVQMTERISVVGADLHPIKGLTASDVQVRHDDQPRVIESFSSTADPVSVVLLIDTTNSDQNLTHRRHLDAILKASFVGKLRPEDRARIATIGATPFVSAAFTSDKSELTTAIGDALNRSDADRAGPSPIWDAVWNASALLADQPGRRAIVLVTDGRATGNQHGFDETLRQLLLQDVSVSVITESVGRMVLPQTPGWAAVVRFTVMLEELARDTGGALFNDGSPQTKVNGRVIDLALALEYILDERQHGYTIRTPVAPDGRFHRLAVQVNTAGAIVHARAIFRAPSARPEEPTRVVQFTPPATLPAPRATGECWTTSIAASYRPDAYRCRSGNVIHDPCFTTAGAGQVLCDPDPRDASSGTVLTLSAPLPAPIAATTPGVQSWFFELADGSTCRPLTGTRREVDGLIEIYACRFGSSGDADAVLGDLDSSAPIWTIQKVLLNKKVEPQTIKSLMVAPVRAVWQ